LNAVILAQGPKGGDGLKEAFRHLNSIWENIKGNRDIRKNWMPLIGPLLGLIHKDSYYNSKPLQNLVKKHVIEERVRESGRKLRIGAVAYGTGEYKVVTEETKELWKWVVASSAFPVFLTPIRIEGTEQQKKENDNELWLDGGVRRITPLNSAIEAGAEIIDVIVTAPIKARYLNPEEDWPGTKINMAKIAKRTIDLMINEIFARDLRLAHLYNRLFETDAAPDRRKIDINVFAPEDHLQVNSLDFDPDNIREMIEKGRAVARSNSELPLEEFLAKRNE